LATLTLDFAVRRSWEGSLRRQITLSLTQKVRMFAHHVASANKPDLARDVAAEAQAADARATVIDRSGKVLADSEAQPAEMENHATRPEFAAALQGRTGSDVRRSHTLGVEFLYVAAPINGGAVRLAYPLAEIQQTISQVRRTLVLGSALALLLAVILASIAAQMIAVRLRKMMRFAEKLARGELATRISDPSSDEIGQLAAALDQTARRLEQMFAAAENSRSQLETLLNSIEDAVIAVSRNSKVLWVNRALGKLLPDLRLRDSLVEMIRDPEVLRSVEIARTMRHSVSGRAGAVAAGKIFQCTAAPLPEGGVVLVLHDLTDIERVERTRRDFIANVSHELRTPLTSIEGYTETLLESSSAGDAQTREFLETIRRNASRMSRLTEDLLKLARVESGEWRLELQPVPAADLLEQALANFRSIAPGHELRIEQSTEAYVLADPDAIHQVFANLIENAAKYSPPGTPVLLGVRRAGDVLEFYVKDDGPGIAAEHVPRLFERFYRVDKARSREAGGTGLGLAIVKHIVMNHGGEVRVETAVGQGSTFFFSLPQVTARELAAQSV
ncbi:MAG TPA: ATP-binding protein, partial [Terriglobales bacterium]|nr:ATP-binding protein [Terriglobales bacterium]